jgi:beta-phosphoglucomutase-like phosphatase (HAD superfamily)
MSQPLSFGLQQATDHLQSLSTEFTVIENYGVAFPPFDVVPLAPKFPRPSGPLRALLMDMDGTTTLTEDLCIHAHQQVLRDVTRRADGISNMSDLCPEKDYPYIIGTSASANVAYLLTNYGHHIVPESLRLAFLRASVWNLNDQRDPIRRAEAETTLRICGGDRLLHTSEFTDLLVLTALDALPREEQIHAKLRGLDVALEFRTEEQIGRALLEIYYEHLHGHFAAIRRGEGARVAREVYGDDTRPAIAPLAGVGLALALARGHMAEYPAETIAMAEQLAGRSATPEEQQALATAAVNFQQQPVLVGLVTSSGYYEARTILLEVFRGLRIEVAKWPVPQALRDTLAEAFQSPEHYYDAIITADESHEIRLKPFRDLYSIAARSLNLDAAALRNTVGFEDTWAGVTAMRTAGVGIPCAVPFEGSKSHDFSLASHVFEGGVPQAILKHALFGA